MYLDQSATVFVNASLVFSLNMELLLRTLGGLLLIAVATKGFDLTNFDQLEAAKKSADKRIVIRDLFVPSGKQLDLKNLQEGTVIEFTGRVTFGFAEWDGFMVVIKGKNIRVLGKPGHLIDVEGHRWWDGLGGKGGKRKPRFMQVTLEDSLVSGLNIKNTPKDCFIANFCKNLRIENINVDIKDGDKKGGGHNTDGINCGGSSNVTISNCKVHNQDDCFAIGSGRDIVIENNVCTGGHGISIGSMGNGKVVERLTVRNCVVIKNTNGVRIKSRKGETGLVKDITFENIELQGVTQYGIIIHGNYPDNGPKSEPTPFPIENLTINNVHGTVGRGAANILVWVTPGSAKNWKWNSNITGGKRRLSCKGVPSGINMPCGKI